MKYTSSFSNIIQRTIKMPNHMEEIHKRREASYSPEYKAARDALRSAYKALEELERECERKIEIAEMALKHLVADEERISDDDSLKYTPEYNADRKRYGIVLNARKGVRV